MPAHQRRLRALRSQLTTVSPAPVASGYAEGAAPGPAWHDHAAYPSRPDPRQAAHRSDPACEKEAMLLLDRWMTAWNSRDVEAWADTFNFPSARIDNKGVARLITADDSSTDLNMALNSAGESKMFKSMAKAGWHHSSWDRRVVIWSEPERCCFDTCFSRYEEDGTLIGVCPLQPTQFIHQILPSLISTVLLACFGQK